jgi:hypothetical protein
MFPPRAEFSLPGLSSSASDPHIRSPLAAGRIAQLMGQSALETRRARAPSAYSVRRSPSSVEGTHPRATLSDDEGDSLSDDGKLKVKRHHHHDKKSSSSKSTSKVPDLSELRSSMPGLPTRRPKHLT